MLTKISIRSIGRRESEGKTKFTHISLFERSSQNFSQNDDRYLTLRTLVLRVRGNFSAHGEVDDSVPSFIA
ncbi:hypothetical protein PGB90_002281 [Kerria lacca]